jgi:hypothetical protein
MTFVQFHPSAFTETVVGDGLLLLFKLRIALLNKEVTLGMRHVVAVALAIIGNYMQSLSSDPKLIYNCVELIN